MLYDHIKVEAQRLQSGDILTPTNRKVLVKPCTGIHTPAGRIEVYLERESKGRDRPARREVRNFNKRTRITVMRPHPTNGA